MADHCWIMSNQSLLNATAHIYARLICDTTGVLQLVKGYDGSRGIISVVRSATGTHTVTFGTVSGSPDTYTDLLSFKQTVTAPYTATITLSGTVPASGTATVNGVVFTAVSGTPGSGSSKWANSGSVTAQAAALAVLINSSSAPNLAQNVFADSSAGVVTVYGGQYPQLTLTGSSANISSSAVGQALVFDPKVEVLSDLSQVVGSGSIQWAAISGTTAVDYSKGMGVKLHWTFQNFGG